MSAGDADTQRLLGEINGKMSGVLDRLEKVETKLDGVVAMTNRWKGATTLIVFLGGLLGYAGNWMMKYLPGNHTG